MNLLSTYLILFWCLMGTVVFGQPTSIPTSAGHGLTNLPILQQQLNQSNLSLPSQPFSCGAIATPDPTFSPSDFDTFRQAYDLQMQTASLQQVNIPIQAHIVRTSSGSGGLSLSALNSAINTVNTRFAGSNLTFSLCGPINYIDNSNYYSFNSTTDEGPMATANNVPNVINIYFVSSINGGSLSGYAYLPWMLPNDLVVMDYNISSMGNVLSHELGHYFGLLHTHETATGIEYVLRTNCTTAGDQLCDTEADPNLGIYSSTVNSSCQYTGFLLDPLGYFYVPDPSNLMSYAPPNCINTFTAGQNARIAYYQQNGRAYLNCSGGGGSGNGCAGGIQFPSNTLSPTSSWQTQNFLFAGNYALFNVVSGTNYTFSLCSADGGSASYDSELTLIRNSNLLELDYADDVCGDDASISWTATFTGTVRVLVNQYSCQSNSIFTTLAFRSGGGGVGGNLPDLTFIPPPATDVTVNGSQVQISVSVQNIGNATAGSNKLMFFVLDTATFSIIPFDSVTISPLTAGASQSYTSANVDISGLVPDPDCYYPGFGIDFYNVIPESNDSVISNVGYWGNPLVCIPIASPPLATFSASSTNICEGGSITFSNGSSGATSYNWDFGGGAPNSSATNPTVTFSTPGTYTITLTAMGSGGSDSEVKVNYITVNASPSVSLAPFSTVCSSDPPFLLTGGSPSGGIYTGIGVTGNIFYPASVGPGTYSITYTYDLNGCTGSIIRTLTVTTCAVPPLAVFSASSTTICEGGSITFSNGSSGATSYNWDFGGGAPNSSATNPTVTFSTPGTYTITLTAMGSGGSDSEVKVNYITVNPIPVVSLTGLTSVCSNAAPFILSASPAGGTFSGIGVNSNGQFNPAIGPGTYQIIYSVTQNNCTQTGQHSITVNTCNTAPVAAFTANQTLIGVNGSVVFDASSSTGTITSYQWMIPGASPAIATGISPTSSYTTPGLYEVTLIVAGPAGSDTLTQSAFITVHPFTVSPTFQSASIIGQAEIQFLPAEAPDLIAAFDPNGNCAGFAPMLMSNGIAYFNLPIYGNDTQTPQDEGIDPGESFSLQLWDASANETLWNESPGNILTHSGWYNNNGAPLPGYDSPNTVYQFLKVTADTILLQPGWNQVSTDVVPTDSAVASIFSMLTAGNLEYVTGFHGSNGGPAQAVTYNPNGLPIFNTLSKLRRGYSYWVKVVNPDTLIVVGDAIDTNYKRDLDAGWNLFGYIPQMPDSPAVYFNTLVNTGNLIYATGFDQGSQFYDPQLPAIFSDLTQLRNSFGYWIKVNTATNGTQYRFSEGLQQTRTPIFDFFQGKSNLSEETIGQDVVIHNMRGDTIALMKVLAGGYLSTTVIYGDDPSTAAHEGLMAGDSIGFSLGNMRASEIVVFNGNMSHFDLDLHFSSTTSLITQSLLSRIHMFPNPATDRVHLDISLAESADLNISIFNQLGQHIGNLINTRQQAGLHRFTWQSNGAPEGMYLIRIEVNGKLQSSQRIILQN